MTHVGIDLEQFVTDPYRSGIQRVLQQLALSWPSNIATAEFVVPRGNAYLPLTPIEAASLIGLAFNVDADSAIREVVDARLADLAGSTPTLQPAGLLSYFDAWLLPEVSYLPEVLDRFTLFHTCLPVAMIAFDALPMTHPANYRFTPSQESNVSRYFRLLSTCDAAICISDYSRHSLLVDLKRDARLVTTVAHPGGDHVEAKHQRHQAKDSPIRFLRLGTMEARKMPVEIAQAFTASGAHREGATLTFVGKPSASDPEINRALQELVAANIGVTWFTDASDAEVREHMANADVFLSFGVEGFGIPVLESLRLGVPVLYSGNQPAAVLMEGSGAAQVDTSTPGSFSEIFREFTSRGSLHALAGTVAPDRVPTWEAFAHDVARTVTDLTWPASR